MPSWYVGTDPPFHCPVCAVALPQSCSDHPHARLAEELIKAALAWGEGRTPDQTARLSHLVYEYRERYGEI